MICYTDPSIRGISDKILLTTCSLASNKCELRSSKAKGKPTPAIKAQPTKNAPNVITHFRPTPRPKIQIIIIIAKSHS